jgi:predicted secreted protein
MSMGDARGMKIAVVSHCILNQNTVAPGLASHKGTVESLVKLLVDKGYGILQLPCPEATYLGMNRWWMTKNQYDTPNYRAHCRHILEPTLTLLQELTGKGAQYIVIGIKGSPSCGIYTTTKGEWRGDPSTATGTQTTKASESGVFMEELFALIKAKGIKEPTKVLEISHEEISKKGLPRETASEL